MQPTSCGKTAWKPSLTYWKSKIEFEIELIAKIFHISSPKCFQRSDLCTANCMTPSISESWIMNNLFREKELLEQEENVKTLSKALANADNHRAILQSKIRQLQTSSANRKSYSTFSRASSASSRPGTQGSTRNRLVHNYEILRWKAFCRAIHVVGKGNWKRWEAGKFEVRKFSI